MKPQTFRLAIVCFLIAIFIFSNFPASFANRGKSLQQTSNSSAPRRGKNGTSANANNPSQQSSQPGTTPATDKATPKAPEPQSETTAGTQIQNFWDGIELFAGVMTMK